MKKEYLELMSPREARLIGLLKPGRWTSSAELLSSEFKGKKKPLNARNCITSAMWNAGRKLEEAGAKVRIGRQGGGRGGTEYSIVNA